MLRVLRAIRNRRCMTGLLPWGPTGQLVYERTYSRVKYDGSKETWPETVERVVDGNLALVDERHQRPGEREDLLDLISQFKILPAGRHLWASGVKNAEHLFNCWVSGWPEKISEHFEFTFMRLMEGGGVGANYSNKYVSGYGPVNQFLDVHIVCSPEHADYQQMLDSGLLSDVYSHEWPGSFEVEDSREGWAAALVDLIDTHYRYDVKHSERVYDVSNVRPMGSRLKTFGGKASGPAPFGEMLKLVSGVCNKLYWTGRGMTGMDAMTIDHAIAQCVVAGGVRRSARMSIMHWSDYQIEEFINCKAESGSHWTTNISVEVDDTFWDIVKRPEDFEPNDLPFRVLQALAQGAVRNGEPGMWDSSLSNVGEPNLVVCTNPCLTGDTVIATINGPRTFADLAEAGEDVEVYSWHPETKTPVVRWMRRPHMTNPNSEIFKVTFDSGLVVRCTPNHKFYTFRGNKVAALDLRVGQSIRAFSASYDSSGHERIHGWDSERNAANHQYTHRMIWENANGPIPEGMHIAHLDHDASNNELSNLKPMTPYEHASYDYPLRAVNGFDGKCANHKVVAVEFEGYAPVYNGRVEDSHTYIVLDPEPVAGHMSGIVSANCGEITLEPWEPCNLGHINLAAFVTDNGSVDWGGLLKSHQLMTRFLIRATFSEVSDPKSREVLDRNRRIGVGHLGVASFLALTGRRYSEAPADADFRQMLRVLAMTVDEEAEAFAHQLRIPVPVKKRTVAPTGTIAKLAGVSEGIHPIFARYFNRRIRFNKVSDIEQLTQMITEGYHVEDDLFAPNTSVVTIPTKDTLLQQVEQRYGPMAEDIVQAAHELTLQEMLAFQALYQTCWADNAVSFTANVDPVSYTADDVAGLMQMFGGLLKGTTMFPVQSFPQAPYEQISKAEYETAVAKQVADGVDETCANGACPIR